MTDLELPSPCPICGKRHKRGSKPYYNCSKTYRAVTRKDVDGDEFRDEFREFVNKKTKTEEFFTKPKEMVTVEVPVEAVEHVKKGGTVTGELVKLDTPDDIITTLVDDAIPGEVMPAGEWEGKKIPVYDITGTKFDDGRDRITLVNDSGSIIDDTCPYCNIPLEQMALDDFYHSCPKCGFSNEPIPDGLKVGSAEIHVDEDGNISSTITLEDMDEVNVPSVSIDMDDPVNKDWVSAMTEYHGKKYMEEIRGIQEAVTEDVKKAVEAAGYPADNVEWKLGIKPPKLSPGGVVSEETIKKLGLDRDLRDGVMVPLGHDDIKPPTGAAHLTVKPENDIKPGNDINRDDVIIGMRGEGLGWVVHDKGGDIEFFMNHEKALKYMKKYRKNGIKPKKKKWYQFWKRDKGE